MRILGIETSCDETSAAVVEDGRKMLSNVVSSSVDLHAAYGGVVPEIAARSHIESIIPVINQALTDAFGVKSEKWKVKSENSLPSSLSTLPSGDLWSQIDAIAVTNRPGLIGSLLIGVLTARTLAIVKNKPIYGINHVLAHTYANFITEKSDNPKLDTYKLNSVPPQFPFLVLTVSGGHTQLVLYKSHEDHEILGQTLDDAAGEAYDKVAKILGLPYPGGPAIDQAALKGNSTSVKLPVIRLTNPYDFSFSGLKTAVLRAAQTLANQDYAFPSTKLPEVLSEKQKNDLAASFQKTAVETLAIATAGAAAKFHPKNVLIAGGVAANPALRDELKKRVSAPLLYPDIKLCTDNAAMIATAAYYLHQPADNPYTLRVVPSL